MRKIYEEIKIEMFNMAVDVITTSGWEPGDELPAVPMFT